MRPIPLPEETYAYSIQAWRRSRLCLWLLGLCLIGAFCVVALVSTGDDPADQKPTVMLPRLIVVFLVGMGCLAWFVGHRDARPTLRIAADGVTWQSRDLRCHARWDEVRAVHIKEDRLGRTVSLAVRTGSGWPLILRGFEHMDALRERLRKGLPPGVPLTVKCQRIDWRHPVVFFCWACVPLVTVTLSVALFLGQR